jgi:hypothetical protein
MPNALALASDRRAVKCIDEEESTWTELYANWSIARMRVPASGEKSASSLETRFLPRSWLTSKKAETQCVTWTLGVEWHGKQPQNCATLLPISKEMWNSNSKTKMLDTPSGARRGVPFSANALKASMARLAIEWQTYRTTRDRDAIYQYLAAVFELVTWWAHDGKAFEYSRQALALRDHHPERGKLEPFAAVILCSAEPIDDKTRSKWSRVLRYAAEYKSLREPLEVFVKRKGGINKCAAKYTRRLGRLRTIESPRRLFAKGPASS